MCLRTIAPAALLLAITCAAPLRADDKDNTQRRGLFQRSSTKPKATETSKIIVVQDVAAQTAPVIANPTPIVVGPATITATPCVNCSEGSVGAPATFPTCPGGLLNGHCPQMNLPRKPVDCLGCSSLRCEWRFFFGGCRAFHQEGPYKPMFPERCACNRP